LTPGQRLAVTTLGRPLFIQAGAGTGKTFTLTKRLVHAMSADSGRQREEGGEGALWPWLGSVDEFMTITFTRKAAGELVGRIREALRREGLEDASLAVDSSWILTIDAMYRRLLTRCALETGIASDTVCLDDAEAELYLNEVFERVMARREGDRRFRRLLDTYGQENFRAYSGRFIRLLLDMPRGTDDMAFGPAPTAASPSLERFLDALGPLVVEARDICDRGSKNAAPRNLLACALAAQEDARELLAAARVQGDTHAGADGSRWTEALAFAQTLNLAGRSDRATEELFSRFRDAAARLLLDCLAACQYHDAHFFCDIAREVLAGYQALKEREGVIDLADLQAKALALLERDPQLARRYADLFKLVMVDEFQDTNIAQVRLIQKLVPPGLETLTTVGDQQQAIYGFRGADVEVFRSMMGRMKALGAQSATLDTNFRSHDHILRFVDAVFGQASVFGDELVPLRHGRAENPASPFAAVFADRPRIRLLMAAGNKARVADLRRLEASMIAREFAALRSEGVRPQDMVLLLGKLSNAGLYRDALKEEGFDSVITAGSLFFESAEVTVLGDLLAALVNPLDSRALVATLISPVFNLSDDALLQLSGGDDRYERLRERLAVGDGSSLATAARLFERATRALGGARTSQVIRDLLHASGWVTLLLDEGDEGIPVLANITKLLRMVDDWEDEHGVDPVGFAYRLRRLRSFMDGGGRIEGLHPGVLQTENSEAVRIMTIHSSKGLEFPVIAVAEYTRERVREDVGECYRRFDGERVAVAIKPQPWSLGTGAGKTAVQGMLEEVGLSCASAHEAATPLKHFAFLRSATQLAELPESQRLLYVACTRAREALILGLRDGDRTGGSVGSPAKSRPALFRNLETGLFSGSGFPQGSTVFTFGSDEGTVTGATGWYGFEMLGSADGGDGIPEGSDTAVGTGVGAGVDRGADGGTDRGAGAAVDVGAPGFGVVHAVRPQFCDDPFVRIQGEFAEVRAIHSYSSLAKLQQDGDDDFAEPGQARTFRLLAGPERDDEKGHALRFGSAFHAKARRWIDEGMGEVVGEVVGDGGAHPRDGGHGRLAAQDAERFAEAYSAWVRSGRAVSLRAYEKVFTEYPFAVEMTDGFVLEGKIDVLALDSVGRRALIIDYKTGISAEGISATLTERYRLQAQCYACAVLKGLALDEVELAFIRPEVTDVKTGEPEEIVYRFTSDDLSTLAAALVALSVNLRSGASR
jgi:ATP-dependent exoDNAse (exonuclease V) beta subunit